MAVTIEFYGIPRERAGVSTASISAGSLSEILERLATDYPAFGQECLEENSETGATQLRSHYLASLQGEAFLVDPSTLIDDDTCLLILSADAGG